MINSAIGQCPITNFGPVYSAKKGRKTQSYWTSQSAAFIPRSLLDPKQPLKKPTDSAAKWSTQVNTALLKSLEADIQDHVENRIQIFFQQTVLFFGSGLTLSHRPTDCQMGKTGSTLFAAAHSSTLPAIKAHKPSQPKMAVSFGKDSPIEKIWNMTVALPKIVNDIDSRIELHHRKLKIPEGLRRIAFRILNSVSDTKKSMNPAKALLGFVEALYTVCKAAEAKSAKADEKIILSSYLKVAGAYVRKLKAGDTIIKTLLFRVSLANVTDTVFLEGQLVLLQQISKKNLPLAQAVGGQIATPVPKAIRVIAEEKKDKKPLRKN